MQTSEIGDRLAKIISTVFHVSKAELPPEPNQQNVASWDSLGHLRLILAVEAAFAVRFPTDRIPTLTSYKALLQELDHALREPSR